LTKYRELDGNLGEYHFESGEIVLDSNLVGYPELHRYILQHEQAHKRNHEAPRGWLRRLFHDAALDYRCFVDLILDPTLRRQLAAFSRRKRATPRLYHCFYWLLTAPVHSTLLYEGLCLLLVSRVLLRLINLSRCLGPVFQLAVTAAAVAATGFSEYLVGEVVSRVGDSFKNRGFNTAALLLIILLLLNYSTHLLR